MSQASKALHEAMRETYEPEWAGYGELITSVEVGDTQRYTQKTILFYYSVVCNGTISQR